MLDNLSSSEKPKKVKTAIRLLILSFTISFVYGILDAATKTNEPHEPIGLPLATRHLISALLLFLIMSGIIWFFLYNLNVGKNWARITCSFVVAFGAVYFLIYISYYFRQNVLHASIRTIQTVLDITAVTYLNSKEVIEWYKLKSIGNISK
jgi:hypothetical protein